MKTALQPGSDWSVFKAFVGMEALQPHRGNMAEPIAFESGLGFPWMTLFADLGVCLSRVPDPLSPAVSPSPPTSLPPSLLPSPSKAQRSLGAKCHVLACTASTGFKIRRGDIVKI